MVAVEAAACGALPVVADQSGLGEVRAILAAAVPPEAAGWLGFTVDDRAVTDARRPSHRLADRPRGRPRGDPRRR